MTCNSCNCGVENKSSKTNEESMTPKRVVHHDHITGKFISILCNDCNLKFKLKKFMPVYVHNLKGYDSHFLIPALNKYGQKDVEITCIPNNEEKYISFSKKIIVETQSYKAKGKKIKPTGFCHDCKVKVKGEFSRCYKCGQEHKIKMEKLPDTVKNITFEIRFIDTLGFMNESLSSLIDNLKISQVDMKSLRARFPDESKDVEDDDKFLAKKYLQLSPDDITRLRDTFTETSKQFSNDDDFKFMISKGVYPYDWVNDYNKLSQTSLPKLGEFYSKLANNHISQEDYTRAQIVWKHFNCKTFKDYHNLYLQADVLLLSDVFENFRKVCQKIYGLDAAYYYTAPGLSWSAFMKFTTEEYKAQGKGLFFIELITDMDMYQMFEKAIRGGLSQISKRYAKANNKYMSSYDKAKDDSYILYLDANNLYGASMSGYLPKSDFKWNEATWSSQIVQELDDEGDKGYLLEVDIHYPKELHDLHNGYACCPENMTIKKEYLNTWQQESGEQGYKESNIEKLITNFQDKKKYVFLTDC